MSKFSRSTAACAFLLTIAPLLGQERPPDLAVRRTGLVAPGANFDNSLFGGRQFERITLQRALELALENNLEVKYEHVGIGVQRAQVRFAAGAFDPVFAFSGQYQELRRAEDITNPSTTQAITQQQQLQLQLNQAAQQFNVDLLNTNAQALNQAQVTQAQLANQQAVINQQRVAQGLAPLDLPNVQGLNPILLPQNSITNPTLNNVVTLDQRSLEFQAGLQGRTSIGTRYSFQATITQSHNTFEGNTNPVRDLYDSFVGVNIQQPLLKNFGKDANLVDLRSAAINAKIQTLQWKQNISSAIQGVMAAYYDMLYALNDINVRQAAMTADRSLVDLYHHRVDLGFGSPFDIRQAEVAVSTDQEALLASKNTFLERQYALKRLISQKSNANDNRLFLPADAPNLTPPALNRTELLSTAYRVRYDYLSTLLGADLQNVRVRYAKNQLLPELDLLATYGLNGLGTSYGDSFDQNFTANTPQYSVGFQFQVPLGNRQPRAQYEAILGQKEQAILRIKQSEVTVESDVDTIVSRIETNRQRLAAARQTRELGEEAVRIAYRRLEEGQISAYDITEQQRKLYDAKSRELAALAELNKSITQLWLVTGTVLEREGIGFLEPREPVKKADKVMTGRTLPEATSTHHTITTTSAAPPRTVHTPK